MERKIGFTIGKFAPLHKGHQFLIETALEEMDEFYIVIYETNKIDIDLERRANWIKKLYPKAKILYAKNPPIEYGLDKKSVNIQMTYLNQIIKNIKPTYFYSSELYGKYVAEYLKIINRMVDLKRKKFNISASKILEDVDKNKNWLDEIVYKDLKNDNKNTI